MEVLSTEPDLVLFGAGAEDALVDALSSARQALFVAADRHADGAERLSAALGGRSAGVFRTSGPQVPVEVVAAAVARAREAGADWVVAHGGGSPVGVAKAVALELDVRVAAVPTTYAGSERTDIWGVLKDGRKAGGRDPRVRPRIVAYDPALLLPLPRELSLHSLLNALAHSVAALSAPSAPREAVDAARASLAPLLAGLRGVAEDPASLPAREQALRGSYLAATALGQAPMGLHHKLAHVLGGSFGTPHAATHATLLPYTLAALASPAALDAAREAWQTADPPAFLYDLQRSFGLATSLRGLGVTEDHVARIVEQAAPESPDALRALLLGALHDRRPSLQTRAIALPTGVTGRHAALPASVRGEDLDRARVVVIGLHGRGASADRFLAALERHLGARPGMTLLAPQARDNRWYPAAWSAPLEQNRADLDSALSVVDALWRHAAARVGADRVVLTGFSQGACLLLTWLSRAPAGPRRALAFTGAPIALPEAGFAAAPGLELHVGAASADPYLSEPDLRAAAERFRAAGARVRVSVVPGAEHAVHPPDAAALIAAVEAAGGGP